MLIWVEEDKWMLDKLFSVLFEIFHEKNVEKRM